MNSATLLLRQIHPNWIRMGRITSQVFTPTPKDDRRLSVYDGDRITPAASWRHYANSLGLESAGVVAVTVGECRANGSTVTPDPEPFSEHTVIDFSGLTRSRAKAVGKTLTRYARERGWQYRPTP